MGTNGGEGGLRRLGVWAVRRTEPRLRVAIAGAGCLLALVGVLVISGDAQGDESGDTGSTAPGNSLFLLVVAAGYLPRHYLGDAPAASAGVTAVVLGVPPLLCFLTFDESDVPPFALDAVLGPSGLVWLVSYAVGPGRGRPLLVTAGLVFAWLFVQQVIDDPLSSGFDDPPIISEDPFETDGPSSDDGGDHDEFGDDVDGGFGTDAAGGPWPSWTTLGITCVLLGAASLAAARRLDRRRFAGTATPFVAAGHVALPVGIVFLGDDLEMAGAGVAFIAAGGPPQSSAPSR